MGTRAQLILAGRVTFAALLAYMIGLERAYRGKDAGDRTFALIGLGAAAFVGVALELFPASADRVIQGVATGVGFLGAGIIFRAGGEIRGLTTAAASWATASVGVLAGSGLYWAAAVVTALTLLILEARQVGLLRRIGEGGKGRDEQA